MFVLIMVICLSIESSAHTFAVGILNDKKILADVRDTVKTESGGLIPIEVKNHHLKLKEELLEKALKDSKLKLNDIDFIAYSESPGLPPALKVGAEFASSLAKKYKKPLVGVNHIIGHLEEGKFFTKAKDPVFVFVSGANTQIIAHEGGKYRIFGEALSIAVGNLIDKFAREIGLGFPGGPKIEELAKKGKYVELPYIVKGMDVEFSGILTKCKQLYSQGVSKEDLCFSLQETAFSMLTEVTERALAHCNKKEVLLIGGVAANKRFCQMLELMCKERKAKFYACPLAYAGDNGIQIAIAGMLQYKAKYNILDPAKADFNPGLRVDQIETKWIK